MSRHSIEMNQAAQTAPRDKAMPVKKLHNKHLGHLGDVYYVLESTVGKTCLTLRFVKNEFHSDQAPTIGGSFFPKTIQYNGANIRYEIWDTAGQERFQSLAPMYFRGAHCAVIVFDVTEKESFNQAKFWVRELSQHASKKILKVMAGNKCDLVAHGTRAVDQQTVDEFCRDQNITYFDTSAKTGLNVENLFMHFLPKLNDVLNESTKPKPDTQPLDSMELFENVLYVLEDPQNNGGRSHSCCVLM